MKVKRFNIPSFDEWYNNNVIYEGKLGVFSLHIRWFSSSRIGTKYVFAVSHEWNPLNIHCSKIYIKSFGYEKDTHTIDDLRKWYDDTVKDFNMFWEKYIKETYLI